MKFDEPHIRLGSYDEEKLAPGGNQTPAFQHIAHRYAGSN
jgi:hypothetical protein